jgi:hypothetical protein
MMNDHDPWDRWVSLEGPPPDEIHEVLDLLAPPMSPDRIARLDARVYAAIAAEERRLERRRRIKRTAAVFAVAAASLAGAGGAAWWACRHPDALEAVPALRLSPETAGALVGKASGVTGR